MNRKMTLLLAHGIPDLQRVSLTQERFPKNHIGLYSEMRGRTQHIMQYIEQDMRLQQRLLLQAFINNRQHKTELVNER